MWREQILLHFLIFFDKKSRHPPPSLQNYIETPYRKRNKNHSSTHMIPVHAFFYDI